MSYKDLDEWCNWNITRFSPTGGGLRQEKNTEFLTLLRGTAAFSLRLRPPSAHRPSIRPLVRVSSFFKSANVDKFPLFTLLTNATFASACTGVNRLPSARSRNAACMSNTSGRQSQTGIIKKIALSTESEFRSRGVPDSCPISTSNQSCFPQRLEPLGLGSN